MARQLLSDQTTTEYFKELVEEALTTRRVRAGDLTEYYLVNLLCQHVQPGVDSQMEQSEALAIRLGRALQSGGLEQRARLRRIGDFSLFMSGFFSDSLRRRVVDVDYYKAMGEYAYGSLSRIEHDTLAEVYSELSAQFVGFMDVLSHISERTAAVPASGTDVLRLYEKWLRTGSIRDGERLVARGVIPNRSIGSRFVQ